LGLANFRKWPDFIYHTDTSDKVGIVTFEEALRALPVKIPKLIELKHDTTLGTNLHAKFVEKVLSIMRNHQAFEHSVTYSKDPKTVQEIRTQAPELRVCAFDYGARYADDPMEHMKLMRGLNADGLVLQMKEVLEPNGDLTSLGKALAKSFDEDGLKVGAVLYPFTVPGAPWIIQTNELETMRKLPFIWSCATDSMIAIENYARSSHTLFDESFNGQQEDSTKVSFGYAKSNDYCHVYQDNGVHVKIAEYDKDIHPVIGEGLKGRVDRLDEQMLYALKTWPYYSGGGLGVLQAIRGDFAAEVDYRVVLPMTQAVTLEMAAVNVDPGDHQRPWDDDGERRPHKHDTFFDPHGCPPYVGVEHDENDGYRINWNLGTQYLNNRYGRPVGDGQTAQAGRLRLERRGAYFSAYYKNDTEAPDWVCVGAQMNTALNESVFLRCVAKRWRQVSSAKDRDYEPVQPNEIIFENLKITSFHAQ